MEASKNKASWRRRVMEIEICRFAAGKGLKFQESSSLLYRLWLFNRLRAPQLRIKAMLKTINTQFSSSNIPLCPPLTQITGKCWAASSPRAVHAASEEPDVWRKTQNIHHGRAPASRARPCRSSAGLRLAVKTRWGEINLCSSRKGLRDRILKTTVQLRCIRR